MKTWEGKSKILLSLTLMCLALSSCTVYKNVMESNVNLPTYTRQSYSQLEVKRGDLVPVLKIDLKLRNERMVSYYPYFDNMKVEKVYVEKGQEIGKNDKLLQYEDDGIKERINEYAERIEKNNLLIAHYKKLQEIDATQDYENEFVKLEEDNAVANLYIKQLTARLNDYGIFAEEDGVVNEISDIYQYGNVGVEDKLITVTYGDGCYEGVIAEPYDFVVGDCYELKEGDLTYKFIVDSYDPAAGKVLFKLSDKRGMYNRKFFVLSIEKTAKEDVLYVPERCVKGNGEERYVYRLDDKGFRYVNRVTVGETIDGMTIITSGLNEGDKVVDR